MKFGRRSAARLAAGTAPKSLKAFRRVMLIPPSAIAMTMLSGHRPEKGVGGRTSDHFPTRSYQLLTTPVGCP